MTARAHADRERPRITQNMTGGVGCDELPRHSERPIDVRRRLTADPDDQ